MWKYLLFRGISLPESLAEVKRISSRVPETFEKLGSANHRRKDEIDENVPFSCSAGPFCIFKCEATEALLFDGGGYTIELLIGFLDNPRHCASSL